MINKKNGFTLIETLLAILILSVAIAGPLTIASKGLSAELVAKDQTTAYYLAQDAVEYVRFVRDSNLLAGNTDWMAGLDGSSNGHTNTGSSGSGYDCTNYSNYACIVDSIQDTTSRCTALLCSAPLKYDAVVSYQYGYSAGSNTIFTRSVLITCIDSTTNNPTSSCSSTNVHEAIVKVTVQWVDAGGVTRQVVISENLFNWQS